MDIDSLQHIKFQEGVHLDKMTTLAKHQALQVFRMVAGCDPSQKISRQESDIATECSCERSTSFPESIK